LKYTELKNKHEKMFNDFPIAFSFSNKQLKEGMQKLGVSDISEVVSVGAGGFVRKTDSEKLGRLIADMEKEMEDALKDKDFLIEALLYELGNHEYGYTGDPSGALNALGITLDSNFRKECFKEARDMYFQGGEL